jgi:predicted ATPase
MMRRYVVTGAPGAGKTSVLRALREQGFAVAQEAATDVIAREQERGVAEPWRHAGFLDKIACLQRQRQQEWPSGAAARDGAGRTDGADPVAVQLHDRSVLCTLALARFLGQRVTPLLAAEVARVTREQTFERAVLLVRPLGFIEPTAARRISYADSLAFEKVHEAVYAEHGFELIDIAPGPVAVRAAAIAGLIAAGR